MNGFTRKVTLAAPGAETLNIGQRPKFHALCTNPATGELDIWVFTPRRDQSVKDLAEAMGLIFHEAERRFS